MPCIQALVKEIFGIEPNKSINPDECVSLGASVQAGIISGTKTDVLLLDVTPLTLSICTNGQVATPMIPPNTTIPTKKTETFSNAAPMQLSKPRPRLMQKRPRPMQRKNAKKRR